MTIDVIQSPHFLFAAVTTDSSFKSVQFSVGQRVVCKRLQISGLGFYLHPFEPTSYVPRIDALGDVFEYIQQLQAQQVQQQVAQHLAQLPSSAYAMQAAAASSSVGLAAGSGQGGSGRSTWQFVLPPASLALHVRMHRQPRLPPPVPDPTEPEADFEVCILFI